MEWVAIIILIIGFLIYKSKGQKTNNPDETLEQLESQGNENFFNSLKEAKKRVEECQTSLHKKQWIIGTEEDHKSYLKNAEEEVKKMENTREAFIRLKEITKFHPINERMVIFTDWKDYGHALFYKEINHKQFDLGIAGDTERLLRQGRENHIQIEEIEKRFQHRLKQP